MVVKPQFAGGLGTQFADLGTEGSHGGTTRNLTPVEMVLEAGVDRNHLGQTSRKFNTIAAFTAARHLVVAPATNRYVTQSQRKRYLTSQTLINQSLRKLSAK